MKHLFVVIAAGAVLYAGVRLATHHADVSPGSAERAPGTQDAKAKYALYMPDRIADMDVPRETFFELFKDFALHECWAPVRDIPQDGDACRAMIEARHADCVSTLSARSPAVIHGHDASNALTRRYLECVNPVRHWKAPG
ncbi:hypothetical protein [Lysobacter claricitrinus]|uniref:hypothetical protein n=1 Tax=Lysobacter claricitrinus TaxID=3367728 RepID=UPI0037DABD16